MANSRNEWAKRQIKILRSMRGDMCYSCGVRGSEGVRLEFAHIKPTDLRGASRGRKERIADIRAHPECYILLCGPFNVHASCHWRFDNGKLDLVF